jgi:hypothetical protein
MPCVARACTRPVTIRDYVKRCTDLYREVTKEKLISGKIDILRYARYRSNGRMQDFPS